VKGRVRRDRGSVKGRDDRKPAPTLDFKGIARKHMRAFAELAELRPSGATPLFSPLISAVTTS
jgi:hypothetical protein